MRFTSQSRAGFTLVETLVAFTVFSLFIIVVHKSFLTGVKGQDASSWSNAVVQVIRSEFALIEAGEIDARDYRKNLKGRYLLEVQLAKLPVRAGAVPIEATRLYLASINVLEPDTGSSLTFRKIISGDGA
ncbi:type II secretion system protein J [Roseibium sp. MMSF_3412]|uniref:PulJ/GspJ family protein n=1 Tax=Roseibium sp. MMSF_3412 TaxID=3046712 RepID=UPI00273F7D24|nr:prepilin-type N-terminal cleavage/methylation domain-containing protein [Roseibium sp. MMSF_3412]